MDHRLKTTIAIIMILLNQLLLTTSWILRIMHVSLILLLTFNVLFVLSWTISRWLKAEKIIILLCNHAPFCMHNNTAKLLV
ncbi:unnamed protein product [Trichobilharzia regenti]|nr:unnamed protein product [Trichobilharzia regenti]